VGNTPPIEGGQKALWNGLAGQAWVESQALTDLVYKPFEDLLAEAVAAVSRGAVLDVGCGTGATTVAVARRLGADSRCIGLDISEPMIAAARARVERDGTRAQFICADVQAYPFEPASVDTIVSRFGVMFFDDPVRAFANLRRAGTDDASLRCIAWRQAAENPFMTTAERAAAPLLPNLAPRRADGPGQFAFADDRKVRRILEDAGWADVDMRPIDVTCTFPEQHLIPYLTGLGPVGLSLRDADETTRAHVIEAVRPAFDPYVHGTDVRFTAACWMLDARGSRR
jgi:ubiquinone/menaquinone biosynthesis C-methylase UbiE